MRILRIDNKRKLEMNERKTNESRKIKWKYKIELLNEILPIKKIFKQKLYLKAHRTR